MNDPQFNLPIKVGQIRQTIPGTLPACSIPFLVVGKGWNDKWVVQDMFSGTTVMEDKEILKAPLMEGMEKYS